ncbi:MAG: hypothetical protein H7175_04960 [Burkholderiales bacterium]|nr:hypothetical protein [Anaerolineae bacterium]
MTLVWLKRFSVKALLGFALVSAACQPDGVSRTETLLDTASVNGTPQIADSADSEGSITIVTASANAETGGSSETSSLTHESEQDSHWVQVNVEGVDVGIRSPEGWEVATTQYGVLLVEHTPSIEQGGAFDGILLHIFVPNMEDVTIPTATMDDSNRAWAMLNQVVQSPHYVGHAAVSQPTGFEWDDYDAAYYTLNTGDGYMTLLLAVAVPRTNQIVACWMSVAQAEARRMRRMLPSLLNGLTVNGVTMNGAALEDLPNPLVFPVFDEDETSDASPVARR